MSVPSPLGRLRTVDFFGVLLPGLYLVGSIGFASLAANASTLDELSSRLITHFRSDPKWYPAVVVLFAAFILGSAIRAFPISLVDNIIGSIVQPVVSVPAFQRISSLRFRKLYEDRFPYRTMLDYVGHEIRGAGAGTHSDALDPKVDYHAVFDYWKTYVRMKNPEFTPRLYELEARSRMFYGFFWATLLGSSVALWTWRSGYSRLPLVWAVPSLLFLVVFALRLRHVRGEEARHVYCAYLVQRQLDADAHRHRSTPP